MVEAEPFKSESVKVCIRCRPLNSKEKENRNTAVVQCSFERKEIFVDTVNKQQAPKQFTFDEVFGDGSSQ